MKVSLFLTALLSAAAMAQAPNPESVGVYRALLKAGENVYTDYIYFYEDELARMPVVNGRTQHRFVGTYIEPHSFAAPLVMSLDCTFVESTAIEHCGARGSFEVLSGGDIGQYTISGYVALTPQAPGALPGMQALNLVLQKNGQDFGRLELQQATVMSANEESKIAGFYLLKPIALNPPEPINKHRFLFLGSEDPRTDKLTVNYLNSNQKLFSFKSDLAQCSPPRGDGTDYCELNGNSGLPLGHFFINYELHLVFLSSPQGNGLVSGAFIVEDPSQPFSRRETLQLLKVE